MRLLLEHHRTLNQESPTGPEISSVALWSGDKWLTPGKKGTRGETTRVGAKELRGNLGAGTGTETGNGCREIRESLTELT